MRHSAVHTGAGSMCPPVAGDGRRLGGPVLAAVLVGVSSPFVAAAPINYGSHAGAAVTFVDVTEAALTPGDGEPLFGAPVVSGNSLDFNPVGFDAHASGAGGSDSTGARLTFDMQAGAGFAITTVLFGEAGDVTLAGSGTDATSGVVTAAGTLTISAVDGVAITPIVRPVALNFTPSGGTYGLASDGGGLPIFHTQWAGSLAVNVAQILTSESVPFTLGATSISVDIVNTLAGTAEAGTQSLTGKKDFGVTAITIPEPGAGLVAVGVAGIAAGRRRGKVGGRSQRGRGSSLAKRSEQMIPMTEQSTRELAGGPVVASSREPGRRFAAAGAVLALAVLAPAARGAQINYGTHMGTDVTYVNVTEDTGADEPLPLLGAPTVTGNSIDFNPIGFDATSANGGSDITDANLVFMVTARPNRRIQSITLSESGSTTLAGNVAPGSMGTSSAVFASGVVDIHEVDFQGINHISVPFSMTFSPSGGTYFLGTDGGGGPIFNTQWNGSVTIPIEQILIANGIEVDRDTGATKISVDLDNVLVAVSQAGTSAMIDKKDFGGISVQLTTVPVVPIPEPAGLVLAGAGVAALVVKRRRGGGAVGRRGGAASSGLR